MSESAADLQREAEIARAGLSRTLDELRSSLTTAAITDGAMAIARKSSASLARVAVDRACANPLGALLIGAGILMMLNHPRNGGAGRPGRRVAGTVAGAVKGAIAAGNAEPAERKASREAAAPGPNAAAADELEDAAGHAFPRARHAMNSGMDKARDLADDVRERAARLYDENRRHLTSGGLVRLAHEQPILVAAVGIAVGAALGRALPLGKPGSRHVGSGDGKAAGGGEPERKRSAGAP